MSFSRLNIIKYSIVIFSWGLAMRKLVLCFLFLKSWAGTLSPANKTYLFLSYWSDSNLSLESELTFFRMCEKNLFRIVGDLDDDNSDLYFNVHIFNNQPVKHSGLYLYHETICQRLMMRKTYVLQGFGDAGAHRVLYGCEVGTENLVRIVFGEGDSDRDKVPRLMINGAGKRFNISGMKYFNHSLLSNISKLDESECLCLRMMEKLVQAENDNLFHGIFWFMQLAISSLIILCIIFCSKCIANGRVFPLR